MINLTQKANNPAYAIDCLLKGLKLLFSPQLRKFIIIPILINLVLYGIAFMLGYVYLADLILHFIPSWLSWLEWLIWPLFFISFSIAGFFTFTLVANLMASPFYSRLSVKTLALISNQTEQSEEQPVSHVIWAETKRMSYLLSRSLPLLLLFIIPGLNLMAPFVWVLFGAWGMGLEFMAYPLEARGILFPQQKEMAKNRRLAMLSFGGIVLVGLTLPFLNLIIAPAAVIGATIYIYEIE